MIGVRIEPTTALRVMETELMDAVSSPYSIALDVPTTCEALPRDIPFPSILSILNHLKMIGPTIMPVKPAMSTKMTVKEGMPPISLVICMATGVVIDFGATESKSVFEIEKSFANKIPLMIPTIEPTTTPPTIGKIYLRIIFR